MDVCRPALGSGLVLAACAAASGAVAVEREIGEAETGWRPVVDHVSDADDSGEPVVTSTDDRPNGWLVSVSMMAGSASWRSLVEEAGQTASVWTKRLEIGARVLKGNTDQDFVP